MPVLVWMKKLSLSLRTVGVKEEGRKETFKLKQRNVPLKIFRSVWT